MQSTLIAAAVSSTLALPMAAQAAEFSISGHINRAIISVDAGDGVQHVDANSSRTRFRFTGSEELESGLTAGARLEDELNGKVRDANVLLSSTGEGMAHARRGGASWLGGVTNWCSYTGSGPACPSNGGGSGPTLRYDTPAIGSAAEDDYWDTKLSIVGSMGDPGYNLDGDVTIASAGIGFGQRTSVAVAWSEASGADHEYQYVKLDYVYQDGSTGVYYEQGEDRDAGSDDLQIGHVPKCCWPWCPPPCRRCPRGIGVEHELGAGATSIDTAIDMYEELPWRGYEDSGPNVYLP